MRRSGQTLYVGVFHGTGHFELDCCASSAATKHYPHNITQLKVLRYRSLA